jgi:hypothetical protein
MGIQKFTQPRPNSKSSISQPKNLLQNPQKNSFTKPNLPSKNQQIKNDLLENHSHSLHQHTTKAHAGIKNSQYTY